jgi:DinB family protein
MNAVSLLRAQLDRSFEIIDEVAKDTSDAEWIAQASPALNPAGFTLWHCVRCVDWAVNCAIRGVSEVAQQPKWRGRLAPDAWFGYEVSLEKACEVAATVPRADVLEYAGEVQKSVDSWLDKLSEGELDAVPDLERNYAANGAYVKAPNVASWIKDDSGEPVWQFLIGTCNGHLRFHVGEVRTQLQVLRAQSPH